MKCGLTKELLDSCVGIHPTIAEDCIGLKFTKENNPDAEKGGCWGWTLATDVLIQPSSPSNRIFNNRLILPLVCYAHSDAFTSSEDEEEVEIILENSVAQPYPEAISMIYAKLWWPFAKLLSETHRVWQIVDLPSFISTFIDISDQVFLSNSFKGLDEECLCLCMPMKSERCTWACL